MTNLTEKLKKGELQSGYHYVKVIPEFEYSYDIAFYTGGYFELYSNEDIEQVLTLVPNYEQWQAKLEENTKLKELLKKARNEIEWTGKNEQGKEYLIKQIDEVIGEE